MFEPITVLISPGLVSDIWAFDVDTVGPESGPEHRAFAAAVLAGHTTSHGRRVVLDPLARIWARHSFDDAADILADQFSSGDLGAGPKMRAAQRLHAQINR